MSWSKVSGQDKTVLFKMQIGWTNDHGFIPTNTPIGGVVTDKVTLNFGDGNSVSAALQVISRNSVTNDVTTKLVSIKSGDSSYTEGVEHTYASDGEYVAYWGSSVREGAVNQDGGAWRGETRVNIGGTYAANSSPVSAVASVVQVQDNTQFSYKLTGSDPDNDTLQFRYGTKAEFYGSGTGEATKPTGLTLDSEGNISWDVRDGTLSTNIGDRWQMTVMLEDLDSLGNVKSYVPLDFVFKISDASDAQPTVTTADDSLSVAKGGTLTFEVTTNDPDWSVGKSSPTLSAINPPSSDNTIWSESTSSTDGTTVDTVTFVPADAMAGNSYVVNFQGTDAGGNTATKAITIQVISSPTPTPTPVPTSTPIPVVSTPKVDTSCGFSKPTSAPDLFQVDPKESSVNLYFTPSSGEVSGYIIEYGTSNDANQYSVSFDNADKSGAIKHTIGALTSGQTWYFRVKAQNNCQIGDWSPVKSAYVGQLVFSYLNLSTEKDNSSEKSKVDSLLNPTRLLTPTPTSRPTKVPTPAKKSGGENAGKLYDLTIRVMNEGKPLANTRVELHSTPRYGKTDENGIATFKDVEGGRHKLKLVHSAYAAEKDIVVDGEDKDFDVSIKVSMSKDLVPAWVWMLIVLGLLFVIFGLLKKKKKQEEKNTSSKFA